MVKRNAIPGHASTRRRSHSVHGPCTSRALHRRGQVEMMDWIPRLLLLATAITIIAFLVRYYSDRDADASEISRAAYLYRIYYDGNIITYADPDTKRVYPGIIDLQKFKATNLDAIFESSTSGAPGVGSVGKISSQLLLSDEKGAQVAVLYNNQDEFTQLQPNAAVMARSGGSPIIETVVWPVTIRDGNKNSPGTLKVLIVRVGK